MNSCPCCSQAISARALLHTELFCPHCNASLELTWSRFLQSAAAISFAIGVVYLLSWAGVGMAGRLLGLFCAWVAVWLLLAGRITRLQVKRPTKSPLPSPCFSQFLT
jgi:uncharacterized paraquat-inducible protein A